ncbi:MAG: acetyl-CoA C-acetyltransferase [Deltaproteobacteria bacterium]|nr:acetyl-CoA C-acetyltransferase [Deltaproteobacteria bacterium]
MSDAYIIDGRRTPFVKSFTKFMGLRNHDLLVAAVKPLVEAYGLGGVELGDVALGAVIKNANDFNLAREVVLDSGLAKTTPGFDLQRACGTGLEAITQIANKITLGQITCGLAGGSDTNSDPPVQFSRNSVKKLLAFRSAKTVTDRLRAVLAMTPADFAPQIMSVKESRTGKSMGDHCEIMAKEWGITREDQDRLALRSHQLGAKAYDEGFYDWVVSLKDTKRDAILRGDTNLAALGKLAPAFEKSGTLTAGNSTPLTDGAGVTLLGSSEFADSRGWKRLAKFKDAAVAAVDFVGGEGLLMAPTIAVARLLERHRLTFQDFGYFEIHEAFAAQVLCTLKAWQSEKYCRGRLGLQQALGPIDDSKMNVKGGSLALGHPFAATGSRQATTLAKLLAGKKGVLGLATACTAGGMGVAVILEGC